MCLLFSQSVFSMPLWHAYDRHPGFQIGCVSHCVGLKYNASRQKSQPPVTPLSTVTSPCAGPGDKSRRNPAPFPSGGTRRRVAGCSRGENLCVVIAGWEARAGGGRGWKAGSYGIVPRAHGPGANERPERRSKGHGNCCAPAWTQDDMIRSAQCIALRAAPFVARPRP